MKSGNITDSVKILIFAAAVLTTCILVSLGFRAAEAAKEISNSAVVQMAELHNDIKDSDIKKYDDTEVFGSDVVNCIKKYLGDYTSSETGPFTVSVKTTLSENTYKNGVNLPNIRNFTHSMYIKPTNVFLGKLIANENNLITGISFTQK
ncbi:MAG: hypothetical protein K0S76_2283 [Herbinix sp.]|nr:hypothetical protein [Herbinix sp.]